MKSNNKYQMLFAVIAPREVEFFSNVAQVLKEESDLSSAFLTFYEPGDRYLVKKGFDVFSLHKEVDYEGVQLSAENISRIEKKYGVETIRELLTHEMRTFNRNHEEKLLRKLLAYDRYFEEVLSRNHIDSVVQELGGFIAPLSLYYNCKAKNIRHIFIEPSIFKGQLFFNIDSMNAKIITEMYHDDKAKQYVENYIGEYVKNKTIVIPRKDTHHFSDSDFGKLVNKRNVKRLTEKLFYKYVRREKEEYNAILNHSKRFLLMFLRRQLLSKHYSQPDYTKKYVYFPLHVPLDFQLTVREPQFLDQLAVVKQICDDLPHGFQLYIKEHPASIGGYKYRGLKKVLKNHRIKLIDPSTNSYDLIKNSACVVTINSKVGAESLMQGKKTIVLGNPFYLQANNVIDADMGNLGEFLKAEGQEQPVDVDFFCRVYQSGAKGELYQNTPVNIKEFALSLNNCLHSKQSIVSTIAK